MRIAVIILGVILAAAGGTLAYRSYFIEPRAAIIISGAEVREVPNTSRVAGGLLLLFAGAGVAFYAAIRRRR